MGAPDAEEPGRPRPQDYPPKTPPPPKRPLSPPRPDTADPAGDVATLYRRGVVMANRRGVNWPLECAPWSPAVARRRVTEQLAEWGYPSSTDTVKTVGRVVTHLVALAVADGGKSLSLHLADQDQQALVLVLNHRSGLPVADDAILPGIAALGTVSCGTETGADGRRLWAVLDL